MNDLDLCLDLGRIKVISTNALHIEIEYLGNR